ncbi:unnamed protein product [Diabrotica balteata]|uniref:Phosphoserine aminotransferase n=1 Tax=Diabrotica balteata TaxID=107213 RepID=A0A9N9XD97_DIABA|nr:unnamed protein product [Diabrotica balteata]
MEQKRVINFGAGPAKLPIEVLEDIQKEMLSYGQTGMSITEISHRSDQYAQINANAQKTLRNLLTIPANYKILFVAGGGQGAFSAIPMNLIGRTGSADYLVTGTWSKVAAEEAKKYGKINIAAKEGQISDPRVWNLDPNAAYVFYCDNDTIDGVEFPDIPNTGTIPLVADMSSNILTKEIDVSKFGIIFAASQKNLGTAGVALLIIREDLLGYAASYCPGILNFKTLNEYNSILNTPPIFSIYVMDKIFQWNKRNGGLPTMESSCKIKSQLLYDTIDQSNNFYHSPAEKNVRSRINITFRINDGDEKIEKEFLSEAANKNMLQLKGHSLVGGIRASLFNSVTVEEVKKLVVFMNEFRRKHENKR